MPTTLYRPMPLEFLHSYLTPFTVYRGSIHPSRLSIGNTPKSKRSFNSLTIYSNTVIPTLFKRPLEINPQLELYLLSFHSSPPVLPHFHSFLATQFSRKSAHSAPVHNTSQTTTTPPHLPVLFNHSTRVRLGNEELSFVEEFRYLGHIMTADYRDKDIKKQFGR